VKDLLRRYLQERVERGEPDLFLPRLSRPAALRLTRDVARGEIRRPREAGGEDSEPVPSHAALPAAEIVRLGREGTGEEIRSVPDLTTLRAVAETCTRCPLHDARSHVVFGEGDPRARVVCVGEAPGAREDETGRPFVGRAGKLLDRLLMSVGFPRGEVYICNVLKSRPPRNRDPLPEEIAACSPYLLRQLELIEPRVIVAFGAFAARTLLDSKDSLGRLRRRLHEFRGFPVIVTYHPAALLRNPGWTRPTWEDLQLVRRIADGLDVTHLTGSGINVGTAPEKPSEPVSEPVNDPEPPVAPEGGVQGGLFG